MRIEEWNQLHDMVVAETAGLLSGHGLEAVYAGTVPHRDARWAETLAIIGLGGKLRGSLVLSVPASLVTQSHPTASTDPDDLADWLAELANLLLGRIKSHLLGCGVGVELSTPLTLSATAFRFERFTGTPVVHQFTVADQAVQVVFEAVADPELRLSAIRRASAVLPGEVITF